jgi:hypothetical protein
MGPDDVGERVLRHDALHAGARGLEGDEDRLLEAAVEPPPRRGRVQIVAAAHHTLPVLLLLLACRRGTYRHPP